MSGPTTTNSTATGIDGVIDAASGAIVSTVEALCIADQPWLAWPGVKQIWEGIFGYIAGQFEKAAELGATFAVIDVQVGGEESALSKALSAVVAAEKSGDKYAIQAAIQAYADAQSALVNYDGSAPPK